MTDSGDIKKKVLVQEYVPVFAPLCDTPERGVPEGMHQLAPVFQEWFDISYPNGAEMNRDNLFLLGVKTDMDQGSHGSNRCWISSFPDEFYQRDASPGSCESQKDHNDPAIT